MAEFTADQIESAIADAVEERRFGDDSPIPGLLTLLAVQDPRRARTVYDALYAAAALNRDAPSSPTP